MLIQKLSVRNFRNLQTQDFIPGPRFNIISGANGQGKTNLLEAVSIVASLHSFRTSQLKDCIAHGQVAAQVKAKVLYRELERDYEVSIAERRQAKIDDKLVRPLSRYFGGFNIVLFSPEDLLVIKGSPSERRKFLDKSAFCAQPVYADALSLFERVLQQRNAICRAAADAEYSHSKAQSLLEIFDEQYVTAAVALTQLRQNYVQAIGPKVTETFASMMQIEEMATVTLVNRNESPTLEAEALRLALLSTRALDLQRGTTSRGPHRDDLFFSLGAHPAEKVASQGQMRAISLAWKTAEMDYLGQSTGATPILVLDDVSSELDSVRNSRLFEYLNQSTAQCFISTTDPAHIRLLDGRVDVTMCEGSIQR